MINQNLKTEIEGYGLLVKTVAGKWLETKVGDSKLLLSIGEVEGNRYCVVVAHKLHNQIDYQQIIKLIRSLGFESPAYTSGIYWECSDITECTFFKNKGDGKTFQLLNDKIMKKVTGEVNRMIKPWDEKK